MPQFEPPLIKRLSRLATIHTVYLEICKKKRSEQICSERVTIFEESDIYSLCEPPFFSYWAFG